MGLSVEPFLKIADKALKEGITHAEAKGQLKKYMTAIYMEKRTCNNIRIYGEFVYLFASTTLITVWNLPNEMKPLAAKTKLKRKP